MRIGILTFHHAFNYGAVLQTEGLYGHLRQLGHEPEIIDYRNPELEGVHERCIRYGWHPLRKRASLKRRSRFIDTLAGLNLSPVSHRPEATDYSRYDAVVFGSDEIWNYTSHVHGYEPAFFGGASPDNLKRIAYAPSLGELKWNQHPHPQGLPPLLARFPSIAVRDSNTAAFVEHATGNRPEIVVDPVFLHHHESAIPDRKQKQPYVLIYGEIRDQTLASACRRWAKQIGCKTVSVGYRNAWCDKVVLDEGPHEFLGWIKSARAVLTTTFHGTMFSIKFQKPFVTIRPKGAYLKFDPLLAELGLDDRLICESSALDFQALEIDFSHVTPRLHARVEASSSFLRKALPDR